MSDNLFWSLAVSNGSHVCLADNTPCPHSLCIKAAICGISIIIAREGSLFLWNDVFFHGVQWKKLGRCHCQWTEVPAQVVEVALLFRSATSTGHIHILWPGCPRAGLSSQVWLLPFGKLLVCLPTSVKSSWVREIILEYQAGPTSHLCWDFLAWLA